MLDQFKILSAAELKSIENDVAKAKKLLHDNILKLTDIINNYSNFIACKNISQSLKTLSINLNSFYIEFYIDKNVDKEHIDRIYSNIDKINTENTQQHHANESDKNILININSSNNDQLISSKIANLTTPICVMFIDSTDDNYPYLVSLQEKYPLFYIISYYSEGQNEEFINDDLSIQVSVSPSSSQLAKVFPLKSFIAEIFEQQMLLVYEYLLIPRLIDRFIRTISFLEEEIIKENKIIGLKIKETFYHKLFFNQKNRSIPFIQIKSALERLIKDELNYFSTFIEGHIVKKFDPLQGEVINNCIWVLHEFNQNDFTITLEKKIKQTTIDESYILKTTFYKISTFFKFFQSSPQSRIFKIRDEFITSRLLPKIITYNNSWQYFISELKKTIYELNDKVNVELLYHGITGVSDKKVECFIEKTIPDLPKEKHQKKGYEKHYQDISNTYEFKCDVKGGLGDVLHGMRNMLAIVVSLVIAATYILGPNLKKDIGLSVGPTWKLTMDGWDNLVKQNSDSGNIIPNNLAERLRVFPDENLTFIDKDCKTQVQKIVSKYISEKTDEYFNLLTAESKIKILKDYKGKTTGYSLNFAMDSFPNIANEHNDLFVDTALSDAKESVPFSWNTTMKWNDKPTMNNKIKGFIKKYFSGKQDVYVRKAKDLVFNNSKQTFSFYVIIIIIIILLTIGVIDVQKKQKVYNSENNEKFIEGAKKDLEDQIRRQLSIITKDFRGFFNDFLYDIQNFYSKETEQIKKQIDFEDSKTQSEQIEIEQNLKILRYKLEESTNLLTTFNREFGRLNEQFTFLNKFDSKLK